MKKWTAFLLALLLLAGLTPARAEEADILGKPFPDFTAQTADGDVFTLSEVLKEKQAAVINLWATWCPPCRMEFPYLNEAYEARRDQVAVIALSVEETDSMEAIRQFGEELGLSFPLGRDENGALALYTAAYAIPTTVVVDRFGTAVYWHQGALSNAGQFIRLMDAFLGENYTQSQVLSSLPRAVNWRVSTQEDVRRAHFLLGGADVGWLGLIGEGSSFSLRLEADQSADTYLFVDEGKNLQIPVSELYDAEAGAYLYQAEIPEGSLENAVGLIDASLEDGNVVIWLCAGEAGADEIAAEYQSSGYDVTWAYIEE